MKEYRKCTVLVQNFCILSLLDTSLKCYLAILSSKCRLIIRLMNSFKLTSNLPFFSMPSRCILFVLAKHCRSIQAFKLARCAFDRLQTLVIKDPLRGIVELQSLAIRATPMQDTDVILLSFFLFSFFLDTAFLFSYIAQLINSYSENIGKLPFCLFQDVAIICYRCSTVNSTLYNDNRCTNCKAPFVHSFHSFG